MFTHLHTHTEYSMLDGLSRLQDLVDRAVELGMDSLAITDHGGMYGAIDFYQIAKKAGVKPIIGCETYVAPASRHERNPNNKSPYHMTLLSHSERGYDNLVKLITKANLEGFYYKPRIDRELLAQHGEGIIALSGCPSGEVPRAITRGDMDAAREAAAWHKEVLGGRYYLELMQHGDVPELPTINKGLMALHKELDIPVVATNDSHYTLKEHAHLQDVLLCIQTNAKVSDENRMRMEEDSYYLRSPQEMAALWAEVPDAITNTQRIAEMCELELDFHRQRLPRYPVPNGATADEYLAGICREVLPRLIPNLGEAETQRLEYELEVIRETQFADYFLVVWDIAKFVRQRDIFFAVRGSAAASLALYCLGVTNVNPLPYRLVFERFLNVERKEMPDIDMDFQDDRREEVINYVVDKYGSEHVAQIITFGTFGAKAAIRDVGRAQGMAYGDADRIARMIPARLGITIPDALEQSPELREAYDGDESGEIRGLVDTAIGMEGLTRHSSTHAAAVVISQEPLMNIVPLQRPTKGSADGSGVAMTQYAMDPCADLGLLKMDFLGLSNLSILARARNLIAETRGYTFDLTEIPLEDGKTFDLLSRGDTVGVFQLESSGMTRYIKELKPSSLGDVAAMIALYRPGPMEHIGAFIDSKHKRAVPHYPHPALKDILEETYGVIVYQDQVLQIARTFAGYSLGEADIVRKAMGKKIPEIMAEEKQRFVDGAMAQGYTLQMAEQIFTLIEPFAGYAFNKAHSVSYGLISYWTAYLKANFTAEYMVALLNSFKDNIDKVAAAIAECRRLDIPTLPPSVNESGVDYAIEVGGDGVQRIRFGLSAVKNVGEGAVQPLAAARRKHGAFESIEDMCKAGDFSGISKKGLESLIKAGALDEFGDRSGLMEVMERILSLAHSEASRRNSQQASMFDIMQDEAPADLASVVVPDKRTTDAQKGQWERELLGVSLSNNALFDLMARRGASSGITALKDLDSDMGGKRVAVTGLVTDVSQRYTREQKPFAIATLALMDGEIEVFIWDEKLRETQAAWEDGNLVSVTATVRARDDQLSLSCLDAEVVRIDREAGGAAQSSAATQPSSAAAAATAAEPTQATAQAPSHSETAAIAATTPDAPTQPPTTSAPTTPTTAANGNANGGDPDGHLPAAIVDTAGEYGAADGGGDGAGADGGGGAAGNGDGAAGLPSAPVGDGGAAGNGNGATGLPSSPVGSGNGAANGAAGLPSAPVGDGGAANGNGVGLPSAPVGDSGAAGNGNGAANGAAAGLPSAPVGDSGAAGNGNGAANGAGLPSAPVGGGNGNGGAVNGGADGSGLRLILRLRESGGDRDAQLMHDVKGVLVEHQGDSEVTLEIATAGRVVTMEWPMMRVDAGGAVVDEIRNLLGAAGDARVTELAEV